MSWDSCGFNLPFVESSDTSFSSNLSGYSEGTSIMRTRFSFKLNSDFYHVNGLNLHYRNNVNQILFIDDFINKIIDNYLQSR